jgi:beta-lactamase class A
MIIRMRGGRAMALAYGLVLALPVVFYASGTMPTSITAQTVASARLSYSGPRVLCTTPDDKYEALADVLSQQLDRALKGRRSSVGLDLADTRSGITCRYHASQHFYAASAAKVTILAALLLQAQEQKRVLTTRERDLAWLMITQSDNDAAQDLYEDVGIPGVQHFLNRAQMSQTKLSVYFGLILLTAQNEAKLLSLLSAPNQVLSAASRTYALYLMANVIPSQRWGTPHGAPAGVTVHVKNGWLPHPGNDWEINSLGIFTAPRRSYLMAVLTYGNPSMGYGIGTIEAAAQVMHRYLNAGPVAGP